MGKFSSFFLSLSFSLSLSLGESDARGTKEARIRHGISASIGSWRTCRISRSALPIYLSISLFSDFFFLPHPHPRLSAFSSLLFSSRATWACGRSAIAVIFLRLWIEGAWIR
ncbi:hypothetical protein K504DRAFT_31070 [Pleomassaria siparia CBS 279.74]|uniref:Secreted protein n=1 Tax=Pleomassaria siparia CBS 279.74 TaxID=1314801 RepID=A0A6G1KRX6_9PLEO|nr:hypothetical protein K504DRAFT_31070 [Pleomassaria siparia CBS 279.74]